jgi:Glu-tRNA(Gln) amidotransferase subunit E-like FAD-binding protein
MSKVIKLTEADLENIVRKVIEEQETQEGIFDPLVNAAQGLKGVWRGEGYDYFKYLSSLRGLTRKLKKLDAPNVKIMTQLTDLKNKVTVSKMPTDKKQNLINTIDKAIAHFNAYSNLINTIEQLSSQKLA